MALFGLMVVSASGRLWCHMLLGPMLQTEDVSVPSGLELVNDLRRPLRLPCDSVLGQLDAESTPIRFGTVFHDQSHRNADCPDKPE